MPTVFERHRVADYEAWRPVYDDDIGRRDAAGLRQIGVYRDTDDPNTILMVFEADDVEGFMSMLGSEGLQEKMQEAGVISPPEAWIGETVD